MATIVGKLLATAVLAAAVAFPAVAGPPQDGAPAPQVVKMTAKKYEFSPSTVTVERGRPVRLEITALDHTHGIEIKDFNVKARLEKGKTEVVEFTPDRAGEFPFKCSVFCGLGHGKMKGTLVVVEPKQ
jgi:cytochrome c oxidase subunit 2